MELSIEQALQQGLAAQKDGKLEEAERLYRAILQSEPKHPDANHNLGLIAVSANKAGAALPLFKTALEANPQKEQFWVSYIDALIKAKQFGSAKKVLEQGKKAGWTGEKADALEQQLTLIAQAAEAALTEQKKSPAFSDKRKKLVGEKRKNKNKRGLKDASPSDAEIANLGQQYQNGQYGDAERLALSLTERFPKHQLGWKVLGALYGQSARNSEAVKANQVTVALSPQDAEAHNNLGTALQNLSRLDEARASYRKAIALKPDYAAAHYNLGVTLKQLIRLEEAEASYRQAISLQPQYAAAHYNLGNALLELDRLGEAEASYRQVTALKPDFAEAHCQLGNTLNELDRLDEAEASYTQAIALKPDLPEAHNNLGNTLRHLGRLEEAEASYKHGISLQSNFAEAHSNLGATLQELTRFEEAEASYGQAIALKPDYAEAHYSLGSTLQKLSRFEEAEASCRQAIALKPGHAEAHLSLGNTLQELNRFEEAEASYRQAIALKPGYAEAHCDLGDTLKDLGRLDEAEASYTKAIALKPDDAKAYDYLGVLLQIFDKFEDAEVCYKKCISLAPLDEPITKSAASLCLAQHEFQKALSLFDSYNTPRARSRALVCLYALGNIKEIYKRIEDTAELDDENLSVAAFASFIAESQQKDTAHRFCSKPLEFLHFSNLSSKMENSDSFITNLIEDLKTIKSVWELPNQSFKGGFQTTGNLFTNSNRNIMTLKEIILEEIDAYYEKFRSERCSFIEKWPTKKSIMAWHITLKEQGYHNVHIHPTGWLSGVIYLKVVPSLDKNEGAITFSAASPNMPDLNLSEIIHNPEVGDMVLFPSSLHHGTIPFSTDTDRIIISFDLEPD